MNLITAKNIYHSFGDHALLDQVDFTIESGERVQLSIITDSQCADLNRQKIEGESLLSGKA